MRKRIFYQAVKVNPDKPIEIITLQKGYILFKWKNRMLCYLKPINKSVKDFHSNVCPDLIYRELSGYIVCDKHVLLNLSTYIYSAYNFWDGLKNLLNIKPKKTKIDFL